MSKGEKVDTDSVVVFDARFDVSKEVVHSFDEIRVPAIDIWSMHHNIKWQCGSYMQATHALGHAAERVRLIGLAS